MKTIQILKDTSCGGKYVQKGALVDASPVDAHYLVATGKAVEVEKPAPKPKAKRKAPANKMIDTADIETRDVSE